MIFFVEAWNNHWILVFDFLPCGNVLSRLLLFALIFRAAKAAPSYNWLEYVCWE